MRAAVLASQLPLGSRVLREKDSNAGWTNAEMLIAKLEHDVRALAYGLGGKKGKEPKMIEPPKNKRETQEERAKRLDMGNGDIIKPVTKDELRKIFGH